MKMTNFLCKICITLALFSFVLSSCGDNDERQFTPHNDIIGTWECAATPNNDTIRITFVDNGIAKWYKFKNDKLVEFVKGTWNECDDVCNIVLENRTLKCSLQSNHLVVQAQLGQSDPVMFGRYEKEQSADEFGCDLVDLGLTVRWAANNFGASNPEGWGTYISYSKLMEEKFDNGWRLPTKAEILEFCEDCVWTWHISGGISGYTVTGSNGNSIFLPASGWKKDGKIRNVGTHGFYWSDTTEGKDINDEHFLVYRFGFDSAYDIDISANYNTLVYDYVVRLVHK